MARSFDHTPWLYAVRRADRTSGPDSLTSIARRSVPVPDRREFGDARLDRTRVMHRAEPRPTHRAELGALEVLGRQGLVVVLAGALGVETQPELLVPVERIARTGEGVVPRCRAGTPARDVGGV